MALLDYDESDLTMSRRGFTLIELLVVIAIIAVVAAILFPMFARAKAAAKQTVSLSNLKGVGMANAIYLSHNDDVYPIAVPHLAEVSRQWHAGWQWDGFTYTPADWDAAQTTDFVQANAAAWPNSAQPYLKSWELLSSPDQKIETDDAGYGILTATAVKPRKLSHYSFNALLSEFSGSAVASPSKLIAFWQAYGPLALPGVASANPTLYCPDADEPCRYRPAPADGNCTANGQASVTWYWRTAWAHGRGINVAFADGAAKFRPIAANYKGRTDFHQDPWLSYDESGTPRGGWYDDVSCHSLLFRPDFDFTVFGQPTY